MNTLIIIIVTVLLTKYGMFDAKRMSDDIKIIKDNFKKEQK
jgi:hypothetical protein